MAVPVRRDTLAQLRTNLVQTTLVALIVFPFGVWLLAQRALTPLKRMTRAASKSPRAWPSATGATRSVHTPLGTVSCSWRASRRMSGPDLAMIWRSPVA